MPPKIKSGNLLSELIKMRGEATTSNTRDGKRVKRKDLLVKYLWDAITDGTIRLPNHVNLEFGPKDWLDIVKWTLSYLEPAESRVKLTAGDGTSLAATVGNMTDDQLAQIVKRADRYKKTAEKVEEIIEPTSTEIN